MKRILGSFAYESGPREGCWWDSTTPTQLPHPQLTEDISCDAVVVGGGFTGLSTALHLAQRGADVVVLEANTLGWGASGRNGGFCCLGGGMHSDAALDKAYGVAARQAWRRTERRSVERVSRLIDAYGIDVDRHSQGETCLAHRPRDFSAFKAHAKAVRENYGVDAEVLTRSDMSAQGMGGPFHGALTIPIGFALNPRKLLNGLVEICADLGVKFFANSPALRIGSARVVTSKGSVQAENRVVATNGYSSEDAPPWLAGRYMPAQSTILVTRPLTDTELEAQGWTSHQMAYDTRTLLHYFRLLPDQRFLFGMRGGLRATPRAEALARARVRRDFETMFPAWSQVDVTHSWSGLVCLARHRVPFVGRVPGMPGMFAGFAYHGNGVAMGVHAGAILAKLISGETPHDYPDMMSRPAGRFPFGSMRRVILPALYSAFKIRDALP